MSPTDKITRRSGGRCHISSGVYVYVIILCPLLALCRVVLFANQSFNSSQVNRVNLCLNKLRNSVGWLVCLYYNVPTNSCGVVLSDVCNVIISTAAPRTLVSSLITTTRLSSDGDYHSAKKSNQRLARDSGYLTAPSSIRNVEFSTVRVVAYVEKCASVFDPGPKHKSSVWIVRCKCEPRWRVKAVARKNNRRSASSWHEARKNFQSARKMTSFSEISCQIFSAFFYRSLDVAAPAFHRFFTRYACPFFEVNFL